MLISADSFFWYGWIFVLGTADILGLKGVDKETLVHESVFVFFFISKISTEIYFGVVIVSY